MNRRISLPRADDLFRSTDEPGPAEGKPQGTVRAVPDQRPDDELVGLPLVEEQSTRSASGRIRHDEKMTVYVTADELLAIERARLTLRGEHGLAVDRGRLVREALALVLIDLDEHGPDSLLVHRIREE